MTWSSDSDRDEPVVTATASCPSSPAAQAQQQPPSTPPQPPRRRRHQRARRRANRRARSAVEEHEQEQPAEVEAEDVWRRLQLQREAPSWPRRAARPVVVAGEVEGGSPDAALSREGSGVGRARSLTDDDLEELKGCVDLGFGFSYHEIPELCGTLPALELCYSMSQRFLDEHQQPGKPEEASAPALAPASPAQPVATNWKISSPGDSPDEVKARLKYWAQAVACTVRLCS
ncbi:uncharacterized protein LOC120686225 [Panicum virgatum]|uniref:Uncharacterized protein n=1 Tax=Panicum virgatum TaxID=38727 RepID=A0A8T0P6I5_PANVG|nr:uncharacterized protein LOC120686225 [Panicum virgatum]KAG2557363.1 hypothetical protein PVAP13_8NG231302 [Panicum virgatum]